MKLTKRKLKQLIKEELNYSLDEISYGLGNPPRAEGLPPEGEEVGLNISHGEDEPEEGSFEAPPWLREIERTLADAHRLYQTLPNEGKEVMTQNFEMYAEKWRDGLGMGPDWADDDELAPEHEVSFDKY